MQVALTGADGFTGHYLRAALDHAGIANLALNFDLCDARAVAKGVEEADFDCLIHLAGKAFAGSSDWPSLYAVNQIGTLTLLDALAREKPGIRCILASTAQVYGAKAEGLITETAPKHPANHYAISKWAMEQGADLWRDRLDIVVTRPFNYTGVGQGVEYLVPKIVDHFRRQAPIIELGNSWVKRDFGDVRSVAEVYVGLARAQRLPPVVNICTGQVRSIDYLIERLSEISGYTPEIRTNPEFVRSNDIEVLGGNPELLQNTLPDWQPNSIEQVLSWMYDHEMA